MPCKNTRKLLKTGLPQKGFPSIPIICVGAFFLGCFLKHLLNKSKKPKQRLKQSLEKVGKCRNMFQQKLRNNVEHVRHNW